VSRSTVGVAWHPVGRETSVVSTSPDMAYTVSWSQWYPPFPSGKWGCHRFRWYTRHRAVKGIPPSLLWGNGDATGTPQMAHSTFLMYMTLQSRAGSSYSKGGHRRLHVCLTGSRRRLPFARFRHGEEGHWHPGCCCRCIAPTAIQSTWYRRWQLCQWSIQQSAISVAEYTRSG
jgi:hypothetical protein